MRDERLREALDALERDGTLGPDQRRRVESRLTVALRGPADAANGASFAGIVALLGGILLAAALLSFLAWNWDLLSRGAKLAIAFGALLVLHHLGFVLAESPGRRPRLGRALTVAGVIAFGGAFALVAQVYHLQSEDPHLLLWWWLLGLPFAAVTLSPAVFTTVLAILLVWLPWQTGLWLDRRGLDDSAVAAGIALLGPSVGALFLALHALLRLGSAEPLATPLRVLATPLTVAGVYALSFRDAFDFGGDAAVPALSLLPAGILVVAATLVAGLAIAGRSITLALGGRLAAFELAGAMGAVLLLGGTLLVAPGAAFLVANVVLFAGLVGLIGGGVRFGVPAATGFGAAAFLAVVVTRYFEYLHERLGPTFGFLAAGALLLGLGGFLERRRRARVQRAEGDRS